MFLLRSGFLTKRSPLCCLCFSSNVQHFRWGGHVVERGRWFHHNASQRGSLERATRAPSGQFSVVRKLCAEGKLKEAKLALSSEPSSDGAMVLISVLGSRKDLHSAKEVVDTLQTVGFRLDVRIIGALLKTYCGAKDRGAALHLFDSMQSRYGVTPNAQCFGILTNACGEAADADTAKLLLERMSRPGTLSFVPNAIDCSQLAKAFCRASPPRLQDAMTLLLWMEANRVILHEACFRTILRACSDYAGHEATASSGEIASWLLRKMQSQGSTMPFVPNAIDCSQLAKTFCRASPPRMEDLRALLAWMASHHVPINDKCFATLTHACSVVQDGELANKLWKSLQRNEGTKEGKEKEREVELSFDLPNEIDCTQLAQALCKASPPRLQEAMDLFGWAQSHRIKLTDEGLYLVLLNGCAMYVAPVLGRQVHDKITASRHKCSDKLYASLVNMYSKCGRLEDALSVFTEASQQREYEGQQLSVSVWTAMIHSYGQHGRAKEALELLQAMTARGVHPNDVTLIAALNACSHNGLVEDAMHLFNSMESKWGIQPNTRHWTCIVDALGRAGHIEKAEKLVLQMNKPQEVAWRTLLGACRGYRGAEQDRYIDVATRAAEQIWQLSEPDAATHVLLSNIYAAAGRQSDATRIRQRMVDLGLKKIPGQTWIELQGKTHHFVAGQQCSPEVYKELQTLQTELSAKGYVPDTRLVTWDEEEEEKVKRLCYHSEKLAIAFGLVHTPPGTPLLISKNLRVCPDCHTVTKLIAKIRQRSIVVRDANRFHHFTEDGHCSCGDFW
ncbi:Pentatricopeptide repeat-containing protein [Balamuthia mandrillaris]